MKWTNWPAMVIEMKARFEGGRRSTVSLAGAFVSAQMRILILRSTVLGIHREE